MNSAPISHLAAVVILAAPRGIGQYIRQHFFDRTFQGLYHANAFDLALLIPYFVVLVLLASYGVHRYTLVYLYYKNKKVSDADGKEPYIHLPSALPVPLDQFVNAVAGQKDQPLVRPREAAARVSVMEAMYKAARDRKWENPA